MSAPIDQLTLAVGLTIIAIITTYDVWTLLKRGYTTTISWQIYQLSVRFPIIPFILGVLAGHLLWPNRAGL